MVSRNAFLSPAARSERVCAEGLSRGARLRLQFLLPQRLHFGPYQSRRSQAAGIRESTSLQCFQIFDEVSLLTVAEAKLEY